MRSGRFSSQLNGRAEVNRQRNRKGATREFLGEFLGLNPGSTGPQIIAAGAGRKPPPASIYCDLKKWGRIPRTADGRYWVRKNRGPRNPRPPRGGKPIQDLESFSLSQATKSED